MSRRKENMHHNLDSTERLRAIVKRIESVEEDQKDLAEDKAEIYAEAKGTGYDTATIRRIVKRRKLSVEDRREQDELDELYEAALGMLGGSGLSRSTVERIMGKPVDEDDDEIETTETPQDDTTPPVPPEKQDTIEEAREKGTQAAKDGKSLTTNPYKALDPRRAAFDEGYCSHMGSTGMDIPDAYKRKKKEEKPKDEDKKEDGE